MTPEQAQVLTRVEQKLNDMCVSNTREHKEIKDNLKDIVLKVDTDKTEVYKALNNRPKWSVTMWLIGGIFTVLLLIGTFMYKIDTNIENHIVAGEKAWLLDHPDQPLIDLHGK
jgi:hypothetical protein